MTRRMPWPWEGQPDPLAGAGRVDHARIVALPEAPARGGSSVTAGELPGVRDSIDRLAQEMRGDGFAPERAVYRARKAALQWDREQRR